MNLNRPFEQRAPPGEQIPIHDHKEHHRQGYILTSVPNHGESEESARAPLQECICSKREGGNYITNKRFVSIAVSFMILL